MSTLDLRPAVRATAAVVAAVPEDTLDRTTPCPDWSVADLLDHLGGLAVAFTMSARKQPLGMTSGPEVDGSRLEDGWRDRIAAALHELGDAWATTPGAFEGRTEAGPIEMEAGEAALVGLNEVVVHGWDLASATGTPYAADPAAVATCRAFVESFDAPGANDGSGLFGPRVSIADDASDLERLLAAVGRRPDWTP
ncbi:TIGR03086 family metal-binding protein [Nocardioides sp. GXQ0305]|uniref:TIGR03086 family metal-binding protein n=1 Tax=Nocardioides sp. GXQ0305 TaxID=3423912 RepID=UPI003D7C9B6E